MLTTAIITLIIIITLITIANLWAIIGTNQTEPEAPCDHRWGVFGPHYDSTTCANCGVER
jgi:hypothetical protein